MRYARLTLAAAALALLLAACGEDSGAPPAGEATGNQTPSASPSSRQTLTVFAAASLKKTFTALGQTFQSAHPGATVSFDFAGSADLVSQLQQGAHADVFAAADPATMAKAIGDHLVAGTPVDFASNTLQIAVPPGNPAHVATLADLAKRGVKVVVCAPEVPCGSAAQKVETATGVHLTPVSEESAVTDVLGKVESGEADAGLVYVTDVRGAAGRVTGVPFPESAMAVNVYPIAALGGSKNPELARTFVSLVTGPAGQQGLRAAGFAKP